jgi:NAD(P)-dependent dehydrogenase (short-subunit alcohol dehydrogenase family)
MESTRSAEAAASIATQIPRMLENKVIVITGASTGIGADTARLCAREGAKVVLGARSEDLLAGLVEEIQGIGGEATHLAGDVSEAAYCDALVAAAVERHGRLDGAFNNAGMNHAGEAVGDLSEETFDRLIAVNLKGVFLMMKAEIRAIKAAGDGGSILNCSSLAGHKGSPGLGGYAATKFGVVGLTKCAAHDYGPDRIRVNALAPAHAMTPMMEDWVEREPGLEARLSAMVPLDRFCTPMEQAEVAVWLLSDRSSYVNGILLTADGGRTA